jgi:hypothetical protein
MDDQRLEEIAVEDVIEVLRSEDAAFARVYESHQSTRAALRAGISSLSSQEEELRLLRREREAVDATMRVHLDAVKRAESAEEELRSLREQLRSMGAVLGQAVERARRFEAAGDVLATMVRSLREERDAIEALLDERCSYASPRLKSGVAARVRMTVDAMHETRKALVTRAESAEAELQRLRSKMAEITGDL